MSGIPAEHSLLKVAVEGGKSCEESRGARSGVRRRYNAPLGYCKVMAIGRFPRLVLNRCKEGLPFNLIPMVNCHGERKVYPI